MSRAPELLRSPRAPIPVRNPRTGQPDHAITPLSAAEVAAAAARLRAAQPAFAARPIAERCALVTGFARAIADHADAIAAALEADTGRRRIAALEVESVIAAIGRWVALAPAIETAARAHGQAAMQTVHYETDLAPYPLVGVISPWNFPLLLSLTDAIPALLAGCAVLIKPSEVTPRFLAPLAAALAEVPDLAAVLHLIEGDGETGAALVQSVDFLAFTGSVATGRKVGVAAAGAMIPAALELGGKDPLLILASADPARAADIALSASVRATGQGCQSIERIYVAEPIADAFLEALIARAATVRPNHPDIDHGDLGPFIFAPQAALVQAQIDDAVAKGATVHTGGRVENLGGGLWLMPTVLTGVTHDMAVMRAETFGPLLPVMRFATIEQGIALANASEFGLSAAVLAGTLDEAAAVARQLNAGAVSLNDGALTSLLSDAEKSSFGLSGLGPSRMGPQGLARFWRRRVLYHQRGTPLPLAAFSETGAP